jgi:hypothetical protein
MMSPLPDFSSVARFTVLPGESSINSNSGILSPAVEVQC